MFLQFVLAFLVLVAASYVGTTMALRGFFGREYHDERFETGGSSSSANSDGRDGPDSQRDEEKTDDGPSTG